VINELNRDQLLELASFPLAVESCPECTSLSCPGWVSKPGYFDLGKLNILGTLRVEGAEECWEEYHPEGTNLWSEDAPISIQHHPYNRSDVLECLHCKRKFLHYTEYGGYYLDERLRELNSKFVV
jgi:hypothetical protein